MSPNTIEVLINVLAMFSMAAGAFGMLFCFPFLWSKYLVDLVGAGFPFVAGSILFGFGLLTLAIFNRERKV